MRYSGLTLIMLLFVLACEQQTAAPSVEASAASTSSLVDKNQVLRFQDHYANSWTDPSSGLRATHTTFPIPDGDQPETNCGPQSLLAPIDFHQVGVVDPIDFFASQLHLNVNGPVWIIVRDVNQAGDCYGAKLIAEGTGRLRYLDNDAFGTTPDQHFANSWGYSASGTLHTPAGRTLSYQGNARYAAVPTADRFLPVVERVNLR